MAHVTAKEVANFLRRHPEARSFQIRDHFEKKVGRYPSYGTIDRARTLLETAKVADADAVEDTEDVAEEAETEDIVPGVVDQPTPDHPFVPDTLLENIGLIYGAVNRVGGYENALDLAAVIAKCGGIANFTRAVKLLDKIEGAKQPQASPHHRGRPDTTP